MPGRLKVKVVSGRHLPIMDRASESTDAFVEVKFGSVTHKTDVFLKSLNPSWNSEWFTFEVDDEHLQDEPLQIRVLDHDTYSSHDAIGKVYIDIDPLLAPDSANALHGWFPIYDTMHGIRGEILLTVKIELFADFNRFKKSSCGIKFICSTVVPECYKILSVQGFVEELVVSEDPEYQWLDKLRTPRATNEARQRLFSQVSGELQRRIGMKVIEMGGNAVVGYHQHFDIEGEFGVVVRGIGTAALLETQIRNLHTCPGSPTPPSSFSPPASSPVSISPVKFMFPHRSSSLDSDPGHPTTGSNPRNTSHVLHHALENMEHPFFTLTSFPPDFLLRLGGVVSAHSVKLLDKIHNPDEPETRDVWWHELRQEIKSHASVLGCNAVVGYKELTSICDELIILSAQGTAVVINPNLISSSFGTEVVTVKDKFPHGPFSAAAVLDTSHPLERFEAKKNISGSWVTMTPPKFTNSHQTGTVQNPLLSNISLFQVPYQAEAPFPITLSPSPLDATIQVPEVIFTTIDIPSNVHITGKGTIIQARFCRSKKKAQGESNAAAVGDILPFVEYELHKQLYNKLKLRGMNALFGLRVQINVGENLVIGIATGTAAYVTALPQASKHILNCQNVKQGSSIMEKIQQQFNTEIEKNKEHFDLFPLAVVKDANTSDSTMNVDLSLLNLSAESKQSLPVLVEDPDDAEQLRSMIDAQPPKHCYMSNSQYVPGIPSLVNVLQTFSMFWRVCYREGASDLALNRGLRDTCERAFTSLWTRLNRLSPAFCLCGFRFNLLVPEDDEIHIWITASAVEYKVPVGENQVKQVKDTHSNELQFFMETDDKDSDNQTVKKVVVKSAEYAKEAGTSADVTKDSETRASPSRVQLTSSPAVASDAKNTDSNVVGPSSKSMDIKQTGSHNGSHPGPRTPLRLLLPKYSNDSAGSSSSETRGGGLPRPGGTSRHSSGGSLSSVGTASRHIEIVPLAYVPGRRIQRHIGFVNMFLVRETSAVRGGEEGLPGTELSRGTGSNWFAHCVFVETQALLRAHVAALGGNALTSYRIEQCSLSESVAKNQAQCLVHVCGDAVVCTPYKPVAIC